MERGRALKKEGKSFQENFCCPKKPRGKAVKPQAFPRMVQHFLYWQQMPNYDPKNRWKSKYFLAYLPASNSLVSSFQWAYIFRIYLAFFIIVVRWRPMRQGMLGIMGHRGHASCTAHINGSTTNFKLFFPKV